MRTPKIFTRHLAITSWLPDLLMIAGAGAVAYGAGMVYEPAGYMVAGIFALVAGVLTSRSAK